MIDVDYVPGARCEDFESLIEFITFGNKDLTDYIQKAAGYTATGDVSEEQCFLVVGQGGTGKSTLFEALHVNLGDYATRTQIQTFTKGHSAGNARPDLVRLHNARFVSCIEIADGSSLDEEKVKGMVSGDRQAARALYQSEFEFEPQFKLWFGANFAPQVDANDSGMWRRMKQIDANRKVTHPDKDLKIRLKSAPHPGILNWLIEGCMAWQKDGLVEPKSVQLATQRYQQDNDELADFFGEICVIGDDLECRVSDLWNEYRWWAIRSDVPQRDRLTQQGFGRQLAKRGFDTKRGAKGVRYRIGLGLASAGDTGDAKTAVSPNYSIEASRKEFMETASPVSPASPPATWDWNWHDAIVAIHQHESWLETLPPDERAAAEEADRRMVEQDEYDARCEDLLAIQAAQDELAEESFVPPEERRL